MGTGKQMIRIGMIGAGAIARFRHLPALKAMDDVEIVVVCNQHPESSQKVAAEYGIPETATSWDAVIERKDLDVIWIGTTPNLHAEFTIAALNAGKHVFCQARMAMNLREANAMLAAAEAHPDQVTMLCPPPTGMKYGAYFEKLLRDRAIGDIFQFSLRALTPQWVNANAPSHWRQRTELSGNNVLSLGIYAEVLGRWLGDPDCLCAQGAVFIPERNGYTVKIPDSLNVLGTWPNGVLGTMQWSGVTQFAGSERLDVFGSGGTIGYDFNKDEIFLAKAGEQELKPVSVPPEFKREWTVEQDFIKAVREHGRPEPSFRTGVRYMRFVEAVHKSMESCGQVTLSEV